MHVQVILHERTGSDTKPLQCTNMLQFGKLTSIVKELELSRFAGPFGDVLVDFEQWNTPPGKQPNPVHDRMLAALSSSSSMGKFIENIIYPPDSPEVVEIPTVKKLTHFINSLNGDHTVRNT